MKRAGYQPHILGIALDDGILFDDFEPPIMQQFCHFSPSVGTSPESSGNNDQFKKTK
jgi:hypothetical protein